MYECVCIREPKRFFIAGQCRMIVSEGMQVRRDEAAGHMRPERQMSEADGPPGDVTGPTRGQGLLPAPAVAAIGRPPQEPAPRLTRRASLVKHDNLSHRVLRLPRTTTLCGDNSSSQYHVPLWILGRRFSLELLRMQHDTHACALDPIENFRSST